MDALVKQWTAAFVNWQDGSLRGERVATRQKTLAELGGLFRDQQAVRALPSETLLYTVQSCLPQKDAEDAALCFGCTTLEPGRVGDEYFMTHGHFHARRDRGELYATISGQGALLLMDEAGHTWQEPMQPGSLHSFPGNLAHRVANTGEEPLRFVACWPADAGHDYETIVQTGFGARLLCRAGQPVLVEEGRG